MHWLVFDTIDSIKEQDLHMNYFLLMHLQCIIMLYAKHMFDGKIPDNKHFGGLYT